MVKRPRSELTIGRVRDPRRRLSAPLAIPLKDIGMDRIDPFAYFELGFFLKPLMRIGIDAQEMDYADPAIADSVPAAALHASLLDAQLALQALIQQETVALDYSKDRASELLNLIDRLVGKCDSKGRVFSYEVVGVKEKYLIFEEVFRIEMARAAVYAVSAKGIYSTSDLAERAERAIPEDLRKTLDEKCLQDLKQAGRCLAFELFTASGFHVLRATESAILLYLEHTTKADRPFEKDRSWGLYLKTLEGAGGDKNIISTLRQLKVTYRDPIMHPEIDLTMNEALALFAAATTAMLLIAKELTT